MIHIRMAAAGDAEAIARIYNQAIATTTATFDLIPKTVEDRRAWLAHHGLRYPVVVAEIDGAVAGWASLSPFGDRAAYDDTCEDSFYVDESAQGRGVGRRLLAEVVGLARLHRFHSVVSRIAGESGASVHLHEAFGFVRAGHLREVGFKFGRRVDVILMQLMLAE